VLCLEIARDIFREGDFGGYISSGKLAWNGDYIYSDYRNTWPPLFSLFSIPLYLADNVTSIGLRLAWLVGILIVYFYIFKWTINKFTNKKLVPKLKGNESSYGLTSPVFLIPFLLCFRILLEEVSNIQINIFILAICIFILDRTEKKKYLIAGLLLALVISLKVYPLLILGFLIFKKEFKTASYTLLGLGIGVLIVGAYFGMSEGLSLFTDWNNTQVINGLKCEFMNQSLWGFMCGLLTDNIRMEGLQYNILHLNTSQMKLVVIGIISAAAALVSYLFYHRRHKTQAFAIQYIIMLSLVPILSPLAWKYYFVFIAPLCITMYIKLRGSTQMKWLVWPLLFITLTSELFLGNHLSDVTEALGIITLSSLFLSLISIHFLLPKST
jgi:hypothetical protein